MKKYICFILLFISFLLTSCVSYKDLAEDEIIIINKTNPVQSIIFLTNDYGYSTSTKFILKTQIEDTVYLKEAKMYKEGFTYLELSENHNVELLNYINELILYNNDSGLQGITLLDNTINNDISYSYKTDGFGQVIQYIGQNRYINVLDDTPIIDGVINNDIYYAAEKEETVKHNVENYTDVFQKNIFVYEKNSEIYINRTVIKKHIEKKNSDNPIFTTVGINKKILNTVEIKKVQVIDFEEESYTILLSQNNIIYIINNINLNTISINDYQNILAFGATDKHFYFVNDNTLYVYDYNYNLYFSKTFDAPIVGISWFKLRENSSIKIALLSNNSLIETYEVDLPKPDPQEVLIG